MGAQIDHKRIESEKYQATYKLSMAIVDAIQCQVPPHTHATAKELFRVWLEDEDGDLAMTRLVNLIIY